MLPSSKQPSVLRSQKQQPTCLWLKVQAQVAARNDDAIRRARNALKVAHRALALHLQSKKRRRAGNRGEWRIGMIGCRQPLPSDKERSALALHRLRSRQQMQGAR